MALRKIQATRNYRLFHRHEGENRPLDIKKHRKLQQSMQKYGFLACFPIVCVRDSNGQLIVKDGQHRLAIAESLSLQVFWVEEETDFDVATINCTARSWALRDYAQSFSVKGCKAYEDGLAFADAHGLPIGTAFSLLAGVVGFTNCQEAFVSGHFKIKDRAWAESVANLFVPMKKLSDSLDTKRFIEACMMVCRVKDFDIPRMLQKAERRRDLLVSYSTKDAYLDMLEQIYNFQAKNLVPLKMNATVAMRERNAAYAKRKAKRELETAGV